MTGHAVRFAVGACLEFAGIVLLGFPDFLPGALRLSRWLRVRERRVENRVRRLLRRPPRSTFVSVHAADELSVTDSVSLTKTVDSTASPEARVDFLLRRDQEAQRDVNVLKDRVHALESGTPRQIAAARSEMEAHVAQGLEEAMHAYRPLRVAGTIALALGLGCMTAANFL